MKRIALAGLVGGIIVFAWGALAHMALHLGEIGLRPFPNEAAVLKAFEDNLPDDGIFFYPGVDKSRSLSKAEQDAWMERYRTGPAGLMVYHHRGGELNFPKLMGIELLSNIAAALLVAWVASLMAAPYSTRATALGLIGLITWLSMNVSYWNWYGFPGPFVLSEAGEGVVGAIFSGLAIAAIVPPRRTGAP